MYEPINSMGSLFNHKGLLKGRMGQQRFFFLSRCSLFSDRVLGWTGSEKVVQVAEDRRFRMQSSECKGETE